MAKSTYLELTQQLVAELGIGGANNGATVPSGIANQTGQLWNAANWVKQAHNNICLLHVDWNFLLTEYSETLTIGSTAVPAHSGSEVVKKWDRSSFYLNRTTDGAQLEWMDWPTFRSAILPGVANRQNSKPTTYAIKPTGAIVLDNPPDQAYSLAAEFWRRPTVLAADGDEHDLPQEYERLIVCEAAIKYANKEAAPEILQGMESEYIMLVSALRDDQLPLQEWSGLGAADTPLDVEIPGFN